MADYISRDYTVENMENFPWDTEHDKNAAIHLARELVPAADVVEVVRCGECSFRGKETHICSVSGMCVASDGFCAWGQRRTDDG